MYNGGQKKKGGKLARAAISISISSYLIYLDDSIASFNNFNENLFQHRAVKEVQKKTYYIDVTRRKNH